MRKIPALILWLILATFFSPAAYAQAPVTNAAIQGNYTCKTHGYSFPGTPTDPWVETSSGDLQVVADGNGHITSGHWENRVKTPDLEATCKSTLTDGSYGVNEDGTGTENITWSGVSSGPCAQWKTPIRGTPSSTQILILDGKGDKFYSMSISSLAVFLSTCER
ncbi:MAG: hypothetical protein ACLQDV_22205 [Candidatus Binataceae bacterium]